MTPIAGWGTGHANVVTFGATNWLQGSIYGEDILAHNQSGWSYTIGTATGITSSVIMGRGAFVAGGTGSTFAATGAVRSGLQAWSVAGDVVGVGRSSYNVLNAQESWADGLGFLPTVGWGSAAWTNARALNSIAGLNGRIGEVGDFSKLVGGKIRTSEMNGIASVLEHQHATKIIFDSPLAALRQGNYFHPETNLIHLQGGIAKQRRGLFYEEIQHAFDHHGGAYAVKLTNKQLHAITARNIVENPLLPTNPEQNRALLDLAERWSK
jgi:hypothetical protein